MVYVLNKCLTSDSDAFAKMFLSSRFTSQLTIDPSLVDFNHFILVLYVEKPLQHLMINQPVPGFGILDLMITGDYKIQDG